MKSHVCTVIPPHVLRHVSEQSSNVNDTIRLIHKNTLSATADIRSTRRRVASRHQVGPTAAGIVPPHVLSWIESHASDEVQRDHARETLAHDAAGRIERQRGLNRTIYDMEHDFSEWDLPGDVVLIREGGALISKQRDPSGDPNECYQGFQDTYDLFSQVYRRNSIDDNGFKLVASVHFGINYQNAFWDGKQMVFGDGDGAIFNDFTSRNDIIGHELTHGVTQFTANLDYENQAGALNESISDVFGMLVKQYKLRQRADEASWIVGEGIWARGIHGVGLRSMKAPGTAYDDPRVGKDPQPAHMTDYLKLPNDEENDFGGVHINSGIPNHAFYLAATKIGGYAWEEAGRIWYQTLTGGAIKPDATFLQFANETIANAGSFASQVTDAWTEVGVLNGSYVVVASKTSAPDNTKKDVSGNEPRTFRRRIKNCLTYFGGKPSISKG